MRRPMLLLIVLALIATLYFAWSSFGAANTERVPVDPAIASSPVTARVVDLAPADVMRTREVEPRADEFARTEIAITKPRVDLVVRGRVVSSAAVPLAGADVLVASISSAKTGGSRTNSGTIDSPHARTTSTDDGTFSFELTSPADGPIVGLHIACTHAGFALRERRIEVALDERVVDLGDLVLLGVATLRGSVRDRDGAPVADAEVTAIVYPIADSSRALARSRADGTFVFVDAPSGSVVLWAQLGDGRRTLESARFEIEAGGTRDGIELVMALFTDPTAILGVVLDVDGSPLAGARVTPSLIRDGTTYAYEARVADDQGRFRVQGWPGSVASLTATHPRGEAVAAHLDDVAVGRHDVVMRLTSARTVMLRVRDPGGNAIARYSFRVYYHAASRREYGASNELADHANGEVVLAIPTLPFFVEITSPGHASLEAGPFDPAALPSFLDATLQPIAGLRGRVVRRGDPVAGALVRAYAGLEELRSVTRDGFAALVQPNHAVPETRTNADGTFVLNTEALGAWWLRAESDGHSSTLAGPFTVDMERSPSDVLLDVGPRGTLEGHVRAANGRALAQREVRMSCGDGVLSSVRTGEDGVYRFEAIAPGRRQIRLRDNGDDEGTRDSHHARISTVPEVVWDCVVIDGATTRFDIVVPDPARVVVRIANEAKHAAITSWEVRATRVGTMTQTDGIGARVGEIAGEYVLDLPRDGEWTIRAFGVAGELQLGLTRTVEVSSGASDIEWLVTDGVVRGRLRRALPPDARVRLAGRLADGTVVAATVAVATDGAFQFPFAISSAVDLRIDGERAGIGSFHVARGIVNDLGDL